MAWKFRRGLNSAWAEGPVTEAIALEETLATNIPGFPDPAPAAPGLTHTGPLTLQGATRWRTYGGKTLLLAGYSRPNGQVECDALSTSAAASQIPAAGRHREVGNVEPCQAGGSVALAGSGLITIAEGAELRVLHAGQISPTRPVIVGTGVDPATLTLDAAQTISNLGMEHGVVTGAATLTVDGRDRPGLQ